LGESSWIEQWDNEKWIVSQSAVKRLINPNPVMGTPETDVLRRDFVSIGCKAPHKS
jgi:hypothetical protein